MSTTLSKTLDKLDIYLQQQRGAIGSARVVYLLNQLIEIQRFVQDNSKTVKGLSQVEPLISKIRSHLGMPEEKDI